MQKLFILSLLLVSFFYAKAQSHFPVYSDTQYHYLSANRFVVNNDGSFVVLGSENLNNYTLNSQGFVISKYDISGNKLWQKAFVNPTTNINNLIYGSDLIQAADSGYIIVADSSYLVSTVFENNALTLYKIDEHGNTVWESINYNNHTSLAYGYESRIKHAGYFPGYYVSNYDSIDRYDLAGNELSNIPGIGVAFDFYLTNKDSLICTNEAIIPSLIFSDSIAHIAHSTLLNTANTNYYDIILTNDSSWLVTGIQSTSSSDGAIILNKLSYNGTLIWQKTYAYNDQSNSLNTLEYNGHYYITASNKICLSGPSCTGYSNIVIFCTDTAGNQLSQLLILGNADNLDSVKSYYGLQSLILGDTIYTLGTGQLVKEFASGGEDQLNSSCVIWKNALNSFPPLHATAIHERQDIKIFPNPTADDIYIESSYSSNKNVCISIKNIIGNEIYHKNANDLNGLSISMKQFHDGMYIISIVSDRIQFQEKFIILKN